MIELKSTRHSIEDIAVTLDALLRVRHASDDDKAHRDAIVLGYLSNELRAIMPSLPAARSIPDLIDNVHALCAEDIEIVRNRCLFYGCDDLITLLVRKRIRSDVIAREEAALYVQDRLQRDNFRRIRSYQTDKGASFVTYMWQVVSNLLLDFMRAHGNRPKAYGQVDSQNDAIEMAAKSAGVEASHDQVNVETALESQQLAELLMQVSSSTADAHGELRPIRERLRQHLKLSSEESVFLKALFQYDLSMEEVRNLSGFTMSLNEAYRFYYRIMQRLLDAFKAAGILDEMRALVAEAAPRVALSFDGSPATVVATAIYYLEQMDRRSTGCHVDWQGTVAHAVVDESFSKLCKRLAAYFSAIDTTIAVSDKVLAATFSDWANSVGSRFSINGVARVFRIGKRQLLELKRRFAAKSSPANRI